MRDLSADNQATFFYLILLLLVVGGSMLIGSRRQLNRTLQQFAIWMLIFVGFTGAYSMKGQIEDQLFPARPQIVNHNVIAVNRSWDGHFYINVDVNDQTIKFVVDTGATDIVLHRDDAAKVGLDPETLDFSRRASTANGIVAIAPVLLRVVKLGEFSDRNVRASVNAGELDTSLLGMAYLNRFQRIEITQQEMRLFRN